MLSIQLIFPYKLSDPVRTSDGASIQPLQHNERLMILKFSQGGSLHKKQKFIDVYKDLSNGGENCTMKEITSLVVLKNGFNSQKGTIC
ncbi:hypothetical protein MKW98_009367 [Papaver atlanticum]|uniref:Uncharacterized protein n=1 Tax=Papaver atlanticum TaxID=357466 RepID=A0AAD4RYN8_9MAGN|nr:hypothetical protein MKW98_009367 [Papaver atlanticum]